MSDEIDVSMIDPAQLLAALYNNIRPSGLGFLQAKDGDMTKNEAAKLLSGEKVEPDYDGLNVVMDRRNDAPKARYFDYLYGRCLKTEINGKTLRPGLYDRNHGEGSAQRIVDSLK